jgi:uncharacterized protein (TIGR02246 family)
LQIPAVEEEGLMFASGTHERWPVRAWLPLIAIALSGCRAPEDGSGAFAASASAERALREASAAWDEAHNAGQLAALMDLYAEDAVSMPYDRPALEGRTVIEADFAAFFADFTARHETTIASVQVAGDWAIERGDYSLVITPRAGGESITENGKHLVVRRLVDGQWKVQWEIWNRDAPG